MLLFGETKQSGHPFRQLLCFYREYKICLLCSFNFVNSECFRSLRRCESVRELSGDVNSGPSKASAPFLTLISKIRDSIFSAWNNSLRYRLVDRKYLFLAMGFGSPRISLTIILGCIIRYTLSRSNAFLRNATNVHLKKKAQNYALVPLGRFSMLFWNHYPNCLAHRLPQFCASRL